MSNYKKWLNPETKVHFSKYLKCKNLKIYFVQVLKPQKDSNKMSQPSSANVNRPKCHFIYYKCVISDINQFT